MNEIDLTKQKSAPATIRKVKNKDVPLDANGNKARLRRTNYFVTINTNQAMTPESEEAEQKIEVLRVAIRKVFNEQFIDQYVQLADKALPGSAINKTWVKWDECSLHWAPEIGEGQHRLHAHIGVFIPHYTKIKIKEKELLEALTPIMEEAGFPGFYFKSKYGNEAGNSQEILMSYIKKNPVN